MKVTAEINGKIYSISFYVKNYLITNFTLGVFMIEYFFLSNKVQVLGSLLQMPIRIRIKFPF
jgi:hypothetical protein